LQASYNIPENVKKDGDLYGITVEKTNTPSNQEEINNNLKFSELSVFQQLKIIKLLI